MKLDSSVIHKKTINRYKTLEEDFNKIHNFKYDYSKSIFKGVAHKILIKCKEHGSFYQTVGDHLKGSSCSKCSNIKKSIEKTYTVDYFAIKAKKVHGEKYDYIELKKDYKINIKCNTCNHEFIQDKRDHLKGRGCPKCANVVRYTTEQWIIKAQEKHGNSLYDYSLVSYINNITKVKITCNKCTNTFKIRPNDHLQGSGCSNCRSTGFNKHAPAILYYLSINNGEAYKIGITNRTVKARFKKEDYSKIQVISEEKFDLGKDALEKEQNILQKYKEYKYTGNDLLKSGNTELFNIDILKKEKINE